MLKRLIEFLKNNYPESNIDEYLDSKYIHLEGEKLKKIADALKSGELQIKPASSCSASNFIFHFGSTIILLKKVANGFDAELAWETDFLAIHSVREKIKGFYFIKFSFNDDYQTTLLDTDKILKDQVRNSEKEQEVLDKVMPVVKGFISAIAE
jgi:hypothetical protein